MEQVECIVVGGGLAGLSAAYGLASAGAEVMVLERGDYSGAKNVTGGRLYVKPIRRFYPELWDEAPYERPVARELVTMMADGAHTTVEIASDRFTAEQPQSYTVLRAKLDQWLAEKVGEKGAMVVPNMKVDELLRKDGKVIGIRAGEDEIGAQVVIVAEGVLRLLSSKAGLAAEPQAKHHAVGYKEVIELPAGVIEDRWRLNPGEGAAHLFMGDCTRGMMGGAFLYTNKESISLGMVVGMEDMRRRRDGTESWQLLDEFKELPQIKPLVAGGTVAEYSAHAVPEGGISQVPTARRRRLRGRRRHRRAEPQRPRDGARHGLRHRQRLLRRAGGAQGAGGRGLLGRRPRLLRSLAARQLRASRPRDGALDPERHGEPAPVHALPPGHRPPAGERLHHRRPAAGRPRQEGLAGREARLHQRGDHQGRLVDAEDLRGGAMPMKIDAKLGLDVFKLDKEPHIVIDTEVCKAVCKDEACVYVCPADLYERDDQGRMTVNWEGCLECGTCMICCDHRALTWTYPRGQFGVQYRMS